MVDKFLEENDESESKLVEKGIKMIWDKMKEISKKKKNLDFCFHVFSEVLNYFLEKISVDMEGINNRRLNDLSDELLKLMEKNNDKIEDLSF